jgi:hypothetical protein
MPVERHPSERKFKTSLLLPVRPLDQQDHGKLTATTGCHACGRNSKLSRCSSCQMVEYCSKGAYVCPNARCHAHVCPECQREDWSAHKAMCKSIEGGTWHTIEMSMMPVAEGLGVQVSTGLNRTANVGRASHTTNLNTATPGANIHGDKPFLVKFQSLISGEGGKNSHMMMYDRQRSFQTYFMRRSAPAIFNSFAKESLERGGYAGLKVRDLNHVIPKTADSRDLDVPICQTYRRYFAECMLGSPTERQHHVVKTQCLRAMRTWLMQEGMYSFVLTFLIQACYNLATQRRPDSTKRCLPCLDRGSLTSPCPRPRAQSRKRRCSTRSAQAWTTWGAAQTYQY